MKNKAEMRFLQGEFVSPKAENALIYTWVWSDEVSCEIIDEQLEQFKEVGIEFFYILPQPENFRPQTMKTNLKLDYLSDEFFGMVRYALKKAKELGIKMWLYDEGGWPSGGACGRTLSENPKAKETLLYKREFFLKTGEKYEASSDAVSVFCDKERIVDGFVTKNDTLIAEYYLSKVQEVNNPNRVDSTNKSVIDTFLNNTYEKYKEGLGEDFGEISAIFTDEPSVVMGIFNPLKADVFPAYFAFHSYNELYVLENEVYIEAEEDLPVLAAGGNSNGKILIPNTADNNIEISLELPDNWEVTAYRVLKDVEGLIAEEIPEKLIVPPNKILMIECQKKEVWKGEYNENNGRYEC